jgi:hypothetical protein|tara:strand:+ start:217 stop:1836 length:1620 start_codon:yes stop_codon:yes gene_type:complete
MAAIITSEFRKNSRRLLSNDIKAGVDDNYFVGLGKTDSWKSTLDPLGNELDEYSRAFSAPLPNNTAAEKTDVLKNLMVLVKAQPDDVYNVIPRNNWSFNRIYKIYDPTDAKCFEYETIDGVAHYPCYVTSNDRIYMCLSNINDSNEIVDSIVAIPSGTGAEELTWHLPAKLSDDYVWAFVTSLDEDSNFYTDQFVDYMYPAETDYSAIKGATGGLVYGFKVVDGGGGNITASSALEINLIGTEISASVDGARVPSIDVNIFNGTLNVAEFDVTFDVNGISTIKYAAPATSGDPPSWVLNRLSGSIQVKIDGIISETIKIIPLVLPYEGLGRYPDDDLPSYYAGISVDFIGDVDGEAPASYMIDVRQISLVKNPLRTFTDEEVAAAGDTNAQLAIENDLNSTAEGFYTQDEAYDALKYITLQVNSLASAYVGRDHIIEQISTGAKAWLDYADNLGKERLYYHQNSDPRVNFKRFAPSENSAADIKITSVSGFTDNIAYTAVSVNEPEYVSETGELIFFENRKPINRNYNQTDEVKLVIQF